MRREKNKDIWYYLIIAMLFLASMNFRAKYFYFSLGAAIVFFLCASRFQLDRTFLLYLAISEWMCIYNYENGLAAMLRCFAYAALYLVGYNLVQETRYGDPEETAYALVATVAWGSFLHYFINFLNNIGSDLGRNTIDIWSRSVMSATGQAALSCLMVGFAVSLLLCPKKRIHVLFGAAALLGVLAYNLTLAGRTLIVMLLIVFAVGLGFYWLEEKRATKRLRLILTIFVIIVLAVVVYLRNVGGVRDFVEGSNLYDRFFGDYAQDLAETGRDENKMFFLRHMWQYPWGGLHMRSETGYAHDLLLDAYDEYGIVVFVLLIAVLWNSIRQLYRFCRNRAIGRHCRMAYLCVYVSVFMEFYVEPIFAGMMWMFVSYCLLNGCLNGVNRVYRNNREVTG